MNSSDDDKGTGEQARARARASTERAVREAHAALEASSRSLNEVRKALGQKPARYRVVVIGESSTNTPAPSEVFDSPALAIARAVSQAASTGVAAAVIEVSTQRVVCRAEPSGELSCDETAVTSADVIQRERSEYRKT